MLDFNFAFMEIFVFLYIIAYIMMFIAFIFKAIAISGMTKRRGIKNSWLCFVPVAQNFMFGHILDNINAYNNKKTYFGIALLIISIINVICVFLAYFDPFFIDVNVYNILYLINPITHILNLVISIFIFKDYSNRSWGIFSVISVFFGLNFIFIFFLRKKVPVSMCFIKQDQHLFDLNEQHLQMLWNNYHSIKPQMQTWDQFLLLNFIPMQYTNMGGANNWQQPPNYNNQF